jgi:hypothetical protein
LGKEDDIFVGKLLLELSGKPVGRKDGIIDLSGITTRSFWG